MLSQPEGPPMLLTSVDHVAVMTADTDAFVAFFAEVFGAASRENPDMPPGMRLTFVDIGENSELNVFQLDGNAEAARQVPMFGRGRLDHLGLRAGSIAAFETARHRLMARGATDGFVTDFGPVLSLFFIGPDGLEAEVCVPNPDAVPGVFHPPGTPAARFHRTPE
jgi:catechol 2,3-dioxygenase-like lactoylglutathione lyase family enzyme